MSGVRDLRREHFSELPEPSKQPDQVQHEILGDKYMDTLERYIDHLASHVRRIQDEELAVTNQFSLALSSLQTKSHEKRRMREDVAREVYQKKIAKIREKRKRYREMMYDALGERKKLIDSMQIQKDEDDILRRKLAKLSALSASETSREARKSAVGDRFSALFVLLQVMLIIIYGLAFDFSADSATYNGVAPGADGNAQPIAPFYQFYSDIMMMAVIGFGFLMAFLRKYAYSAIGFTLLTVAFSFQWAIAVLNFFVQLPGSAAFVNVQVSQVDLVAAMYAVITVLISFGGVLGVVSSVQLLVIAFVEVVLYALNLHISRHILQLYNGAPWSAFGLGGDAAPVHVFGAFFGLALAVPLGMKVRKGKGRDDQIDSYQSDMFAMIGTVFLWVLWPSFNAALAPAGVQHRIVVNTVLALAASVVFAFLGSRVFRGGKFDMTDIQSATLAGGVGIGSGAAVVVGPGSALIIGAVCAIVSTLGSAYVGPLLNKAGVIDTRGVLSMHGLPGILGSLSAIVAVAIAFNDEADETVFGDDLNVLFPRGQVESAYMLLGLVISLAIAVVGGVIVGGILSIGTKGTKRLFSDEKHFRVPGDFPLSAEED